MISLTDLLTADFFLYALIAGISLSVVVGPLGSFIVWRRMSYFGDTLAHSALLGIAIGLITGGNPQLSIIISCLLIGALLVYLDKNPNVSTDTLLGILAHSTLAVGVVLLALTESVRVNLEAYLFGALLTINSTDLLWVVVIVALVAIVLYRFWNDFLSATVHAELAQIEGIDVSRCNLYLVLLIALTIAVSMKIVGILLITSLLIIPPAAARKFAESPEKMAFLASLIGAISILLGLFSAFYFDTPVGPTIVVIAALIFLIVNFLPTVQQSNS
ncbi:MAG: metal ABC transporter permease [Gammaproteobacteria bacterium]|nr:metal ABC transporter permease [Gammaproteobacteria bacterium]MDD9958087.1 metal ABC transporter permease [Gammaproteobacteria bacterium]